MKSRCIMAMKLGSVQYILAYKNEIRVRNSFESIRNPYYWSMSLR